MASKKPEVPPKAPDAASNGPIVIKVGTSSLLNDTTGCLALGIVASLCSVISQIHRQGRRVVLVSSGSVGFGRIALHKQNKKPPTSLSGRRALAAIGQARLMAVYDNFFTSQNMVCAQVLLTYQNLGEQAQYQSSQRTFEELFKMGVIPIVNENDTVAEKYTKFGDNDCLSAMVAILVKAERLYLLTDVDGLYTSNPMTDPSAKLIPVVKDMRELANVSTSESGSKWGTGGMATKLKAAEIASNSGVRTVILRSTSPELVGDDLAGKSVGTAFLPTIVKARSTRKQWIRALPIRGEVWVDAGAVKALYKKQSLFAAGVKRVRSDEKFQRNEVVRVCDGKGDMVALGLVNYSWKQMGTMKGKKSNQIDAMDTGPKEIIHRSNLLLIRTQSSVSPPSSAPQSSSTSAPPMASAMVTPPADGGVPKLPSS